jgi:hypothetical protein
VFIEFQDSSTLVDFMVMDMDPHQQTSIILGQPFLKSVRVTIDKKRGNMNMKVDKVHEKFIYHPKVREKLTRWNRSLTVEPGELVCVCVSVNPS